MTQGELLRQEQRAGVVPVSQLARTAAVSVLGGGGPECAADASWVLPPLGGLHGRGWPPPPSQSYFLADRFERNRRHRQPFVAGHPKTDAPPFDTNAEHHREASTVEKPGSEYAHLLELLSGSGLSPPSHRACRSAVLALQQMLDPQESAGQSPLHGLVRVPRDYVEMLAQRRPEALAILACYAVLIHRTMDY